MNNSINSISPIYRDSLLGKNIIKNPHIMEYYSESELSGLGVPLQLSNKDIVVKGLNIKDNYSVYLNNSINKNVFNIEDATLITLNEDKRLLSEHIDRSDEYYFNATKFNTYSDGNDKIDRFSIKEVKVNPKNKTYIDSNGKLNLGGFLPKEPFDIIGSITSGRGFSLGNDGLESNFDTNSRVSGRILSGLGVIEDTELGNIARRQLALTFQQNVLQNAQNETLGKLKVDILKGTITKKKDYTITKKSIFEDFGLVNVAETLLNSDFSSDDALGIDLSNKDYSEDLIKQTGKGQVTALFDNLNNNDFQPNYEYSNKLKTKPKEDVELIDLNYEESMINERGIEKSTSTDFYTDANPLSLNGRSPNSLISKTREMFNDTSDTAPIKVQRDGLTLKPMQFHEDSEISTSMIKGKYLYSRGSGVLSEKYLKDGQIDDDTACRTFNIKKQYNTIEALQKNSGLFTYKNDDGTKSNKIRENTNLSVLDTNGFIKASPYKTTNLGDLNNDNYNKKFMLSLENLAWANDFDKLPEREKGLGDPVTKTRGRIMWFPPYDINFSESTSIDKTSYNFIGRGEPVHMYNNSSRKANLSFMIIIDHPAYVNDPMDKDNYDEIIASIVAGCSEYKSFFSQNELSTIKNQYSKKPTENVDAIAETPSSVLSKAINVYFPNDVSQYNPQYESGLTMDNEPNNRGIGDIEVSGEYCSSTSNSYKDSTDFGLNKTFNDIIDSDYNEIAEDLNLNCPSCVININGFASSAGNNECNLKLSKDRGNQIKEMLISNLSRYDIEDLEKRIIVKPKEESNASVENTSGDINSKPVKLARYVSVKIESDVNRKEEITKSLAKKNTEEEKERKEEFQTRFNNSIKKRFHNEFEYFERLKNAGESGDEGSKVIFDTFKDKIKHFQPAFHSMTPEGFNSRLTFLNQCTRQGSIGGEIKSKNIAFGAPPVLILRLGDFFNTKVMLDNLSISYEPLVWDLNPEGVGVQPMLAKVDMSLDVIGGASLEGPINRLQNALSFDYYANTEVYDPRSNTINSNKDGYDTLIKDENELADNKANKNDTEPKDKVQEPEVESIQSIINENISNSIEAFNKDIELIESGVYTYDEVNKNLNINLQSDELTYEYLVQVKNKYLSEPNSNFRQSGSGKLDVGFYNIDIPLLFSGDKFKILIKNSKTNEVITTINKTL